MAVIDTAPHGLGRGGHGARHALIFAITIFFAAALLFTVEPLMGKIVLPLLGGSPAVWNTCILFFQAVLLLAYLYAHALHRLPARAQLAIHLLVVAGAAAVLPIPTNPGAPDAAGPTWWLLRTLAVTVGPPFFAIAASGPLFQGWFSRTDHPKAADPYFLYAASNAGSMLGLLCYPLLLEPLLTRKQQSLVWTGAYGVLILGVAACGLVLLRRAWPVARNDAGAVAAESDPPTTLRTRAKWVMLALVPSSLMLGVTHHISTDIAAVPLLWAIPLLLYLLSFVLAFARKRHGGSAVWGRVLPVAVVITLVTMLALAHSPVLVIVCIHLATFFIAAMMCHCGLADERPHARHLTEYYLLIALGGVLGGAFNSLLAPFLFSTILEYPLVMGVACLLRPQLQADAAGRAWVRRFVALACAAALVVLVMAIDHAAERGLLTNNAVLDWARGFPILRGRIDDSVVIIALRAGVPAVLCMALLRRGGSLRFGVTVAALLVSTQFIGATGLVLARERSFFGVSTVAADPDGAWVQLSHGTTLHGIQAHTHPRHPDYNDSISLSRTPTSYYHPLGPIGDIVRMLKQTDRFHSAGFIGLGVGSLAAYAIPGVTFDFYEIDPTVIRIASNPAYFTYLSDARADPTVNIRIIPGDGRLGIAQPPGHTYDLIVIDAFTSDAIPVHLITREACQLYFSRLNDHGVVAFHISSRYFDLGMVLARLATDLGVFGLIRVDPQDLHSEGKRESTWVALARTPEDCAGLIATGEWKPLRTDLTDRPWTDDYTNILGIFAGW